MSIVWIVVLTIFVLLIALIASLLVIPLDYKFLFAYSGGLQGTVTFNSGRLYTCRIDVFEDPPVLHIDVLGLHFEKRLQVAQAPSPSPEEVKPAAEVAEPAYILKEKVSAEQVYRPSLRERASDALDYVHFWSDTRFFREAWAFVKDMIRIVNPEHVEISGRFGFENPDHTGYLLLLTVPLMNRSRRVQFDVEPVWDQEIFEFHADCFGRMNVYAFLFRGLKFARNKKIRNKLDEFREFEDRRAIRQERAAAKG